MANTNPNTIKEWRKGAKARLAQLVDKELEKGCMDCGNKHPAVLQFHHRQGEKPHRDRSVRTMVRRCRTLPAIMDEIAKCDVLCANCHLIRHYNENSGFFEQRL